jgi:glycosyltransferase involved in cell wall biosynthesis
MSGKPRASIIIPSRGMDECLRRLFNALIPEISRKDVEVILIDDGSDKPLDFLAEEYAGRLNLKVVRQDPLGPAAARNLGIKSSAADIIVFLDSDVKPLPGWFEGLVKRLESDKDLAGVEGKTVCGNFADLNPFSHFLDNLEGGKYLTCNMAYRREWIERVGGFDERFKHPWREDSDLAFSILDNGGNIVFEKNAVIDHPVRPLKLWRLFWFYPVRRGYDWLLFRKHPKRYHQIEKGLFDRSEFIFAATFLFAVLFFVLGWFIPGFIALIFHQAIYNHLLLRRLHFGGRVANNLAVPWKIFAKAYLFFWPSTFLSLASIFWGWLKFITVKESA